MFIFGIITALLAQFFVGINYKYAWVTVLVSSCSWIAYYVNNKDKSSIILQILVLVAYITGLVWQRMAKKRMSKYEAVDFLIK